MEYKGVKDTVKATGIWCEKTNFRNSGDKLSNDADGAQIADSFKIVYGNILGLAIKPAPVGVINAMEMEFKVMPDNIGNEPDIKFDITRQIEVIEWKNVFMTWLDCRHPITLTPIDELPTDDKGSADEDNIPHNNHIYSIDGVGYVTPIAFADEVIERFNFNEFVRVKFSGVFKNDESIEGSRCSVKNPWRARIRLKKGTTNVWERNSVEQNDNEIEENHLSVGTKP